MLGLVAVIDVAVVVLARNNRARDGSEEDTGRTHRDDDKYWRGGLIYVNREDHALVVPRGSVWDGRSTSAILGPQCFWSAWWRCSAC